MDQANTILLENVFLSSLSRAQLPALPFELIINHTHTVEGIPEPTSKASDCQSQRLCLRLCRSQRHGTDSVVFQGHLVPVSSEHFV